MTEHRIEIPHDVESEQALVYTAMIDPTRLDAIEGRLSSTDFFDRDLGRAFAMLRDLHVKGEPVGDSRVVSETLVAAGIVPRERVVPFLATIAGSTALPSYAQFYAARVSHAARLREIMEVARRSAERARDPSADPVEIAESLDAKLSAIVASNRSEAERIGVLMHRAIDRIDEAARRSDRMGMPTGIAVVDSKLGGLFAGELIILAARPGIGKTALALQIARHVAGKDRQVLFASLEMSGVELASRCMCSEAMVSQADLRTGEVGPSTRERLREVADTFDAVPLDIWAPARATPPQIRAAARIASAKGRMGLVVVDYIGLVRPAHDDRGRQRHEQVAEVTRSLKSLSKELDCPVLALSQVNREAAKEKVLQLHHLRESGAIEQDADQVWMLQRNDDSSPTIDIAKNRHGETGSIEVRWDGAHTRFTDPDIRDHANYEPAFGDWA